jgi:hypothetical protein
VKVLGIEPHALEGKIIYFLKLEHHNYSYQYTKQNKKRENDMILKSKMQQGNNEYKKIQRFPNHHKCERT